MGKSGGPVTTRDGRVLHLEAHGERPPHVVFESGMGASRSMWGAVSPGVAERATAVVYDRSGLGRSPRDAAARDLARLSGDLVDVLEHLGGTPAVLVGHSWGGPIVRSVAATRPDLVAGLVLVDQTDEGCELFFSKGRERSNRTMTALMPIMARVGLVRMGVKRIAAPLPEPARSSMIAEDGTLAATRTLVAEMASFYDDLRHLRDVPLALPDVPVSVISGLVTSRAERGYRPQLIAAHRACAAALPRGRHVEAARSGHHVPLSEPDLVVEEINRILDTISPQEQTTE